MATSDQSGELPTIEYAQEYIGECIVGSCERPATVRIFEDYILCALHDLHRDAGQAQDDAGVSLELIKGWRSIAQMHRLGYLLEVLQYAERALLERLGEAKLLMAKVEQIDREVDESLTRKDMGEARRAREEAESRREEASAAETKQEAEPSAPEGDVLDQVTHLLSDASLLLREYSLPEIEEEQAACEALHALSGAGTIVAGLRRRRRERERDSEVSSDPPENGGRASA